MCEIIEGAPPEQYSKRNADPGIRTALLLTRCVGNITGWPTRAGRGCGCGLQNTHPRPTLTRSAGYPNPLRVIFLTIGVGAGFLLLISLICLLHRHHHGDKSPIQVAAVLLRLKVCQLREQTNAPYQSTKFLAINKQSTNFSRRYHKLSRVRPTRADTFQSLATDLALTDSH